MHIEDFISIDGQEKKKASISNYYSKKAKGRGKR